MNSSDIKKLVTFTDGVKAMFGDVELSLVVSVNASDPLVRRSVVELLMLAGYAVAGQEKGKMVEMGRSGEGERGRQGDEERRRGGEAKKAHDPRVCSVCGDEFIPMSGVQKFCGKCRKAGYSESGAYRVPPKRKLADTDPEMAAEIAAAMAEAVDGLEVVVNDRS